MKITALLVAAAVALAAPAANAATTDVLPGGTLTEYQAGLLLGARVDLPLKLDEVTTFTAVSFDGLTLVYDYTLAFASSPDLDLAGFRTTQLPQFCAVLNDLGRAGELEALRFRYTTSDGKELVIDVGAADCAA